MCPPDKSKNDKNIRWNLPEHSSPDPSELLITMSLLFKSPSMSAAHEIDTCSNSTRLGKPPSLVHFDYTYHSLTPFHSTRSETTGIAPRSEMTRVHLDVMCHSHFMSF